MPSNQTANYQLNQWAKPDRIMMDDFNADNQKLDAALKANADTIAEHGVKLTQLGNCEIYFSSYTGSGTTSRSLIFPRKPLLVCIFGAKGHYCLAVQGIVDATLWLYGSGSYTPTCTWSGNSLTLTSSTDTGAANGANEQFNVVALMNAEE